MMAHGVLKAFEELDIRCPNDVALATFDDLAVDSPFHPHLTAVVQPSYEMGARATTILIDRIEGRLTKEAFVVRVAPTLVLRESTEKRLRLESRFEYNAKRRGRSKQHTQESMLTRPII
jgi:DNA-binding LacI/PurR family transcriptional regulator